MKQRERHTETLKREMVKDKGCKNGREKKKPERDGLDAATYKNCVFLYFKHSSSQMS